MDLEVEDGITISDYVNLCDAEKPPAGVIQFYNTSSQSEDDETRLTNILAEEWLSKQANINVCITLTT